MITFACEKCGQGLEVDDSAAGMPFNCPTCSQPIQVPAVQQPSIRLAAAPEALPPSTSQSVPSAPSMPKYIRQGTAMPRQPPSAPSAQTVCPSCGIKTGAGTRFCHACGAPTSSSVTAIEAASVSGAGVRSSADTSEWCYPSNPPRSPNFAWLNIVGGIGIAQLVFGQVKKGILLMICGNVLIMIAMAMASSGIAAANLFAIAWLGLLIASTFDAFEVGKCLFRGKPVREFDWFP